MATALARLRLVDVVEKADVNEAMRLMEMSKDSLTRDDRGAATHAQTVTDKIFAVIRDLATSSGARTLKIADVRERCVEKGYKPDEIEEAIEEYEQLDVFSVNQTKTRLTFVDKL